MLSVKLYCEYMENPCGIDFPEPRFNWSFSGESKSHEQQAYRLLVSNNPNDINNNIGNCWDSGVVKSSDTLNIVYAGLPLRSATKYYVIVQVYDDTEKLITSSVQTFVTGLMNKDEWIASWIGGPTVQRSCFWYRKDFELKASIKTAIAYVASPCYYALTVNGKKSDTSVLNNAWTDCDKSVLYSTFEITSLLNSGSNAIGVESGYGWHNLRESEDNVGWGESLFSAQLIITYEDGTTEALLSDLDGWYYSTVGPIKYNSIYNGETYDARDEIFGWDLPSYEMDTNWKQVVEHEPPAGVLRSQYLEPIRIVDEIKQPKILEVGDGSYTLDFGQNFAGWTRLSICGERGQEIVLKHAELINADNTINPISLRRARATDTYTLKGGQVETYEPRFTYHGFRYVQVFGLTEKPTPGMFVGCIVRSDVERIGSFKCDNDLVNKLYENIQWTESSNLHGLPTDCPQRDERLGWLNDMTVRNECAIYNFRLPQLYTKWLQDIRDAQGRTTGAITDTAPFVRYGLRPADPVSSSFLLIPWNIYQHYGDTRIIENNYEAMKKWVGYLKRNSNDYVLRYSQMGDWAAPVVGTDIKSIGSGAVSVITPTILMATGYFYYDCLLMSKMATVLGHFDDAEYYAAEAECVADAFQSKFYQVKEKYYANNSQAGNTFPLYLGITPQDDHTDVVEKIKEDIRKNGHLTTGNLCSRYIIEVLLKNGEEDLAWKLLTKRDYPSWGFMIDNGATTIWERWENVVSPGPLMMMASHNHPMNGAVGVCFHKYFGGMQVDESVIGFSHFTIKPVMPDGLNNVDCTLNTVQGLVRSSWARTDDTVIMSVTVPFNTTATVHLPVKGIDKNDLCIISDAISVNNSEITYSLPSIKKSVRITDGYWAVGLRSGEYKFIIGSNLNSNNYNDPTSM